MRRQAGQCRIGHPENTVRLIAQLLPNFFRRRLGALEQTLPDRINAVSQGCDPPRPGDCQTHASNFRITMEAFVPPNPKEFESAVPRAAGRASFDTTASSISSSGARK